MLEECGAGKFVDGWMIAVAAVPVGEGRVEKELCIPCDGDVYRGQG